MQHFTLIAIKQISRWMPFLKIRLTVWFVASKNVNAVEVQDELQKTKTYDFLVQSKYFLDIVE